MRTLRTAPVLVAMLTALGASRLPAQESGAPPDPALAAWLVTRDLDPDSAVVVDAEVGEDFEALILRLDGDRREYWTVSRPVTSSHAIRRLGMIPGHWTDLSIEAVLDGDVYVRKLGSYGQAYLHRYLIAADGSVGDGQLVPPRPGPIAVLGDSAYAAWSLGQGGQLALAASMTDGGAAAFHFRVDEPIESIGLRGDSIAFRTAKRAIVRHAGGGWGGYGLRRLPYDPAGVRVLHPSLPQFRVVPGGLAELRLGDTLFIPLDYPDLDHFRRARPDHLWGLGEVDHIEIAVDVGPVTDDGERVWFGLTFYDGEGLDGVGGVGWLDPVTREADLLYPPEMADFSVSAIAVDRGELLLALAVFGEGAVHGAGLARYDPATRTFERILESVYVGAIAAHGDRILVTSDQGLLEVGPRGSVRRWQVFPPRRPGGVPPVNLTRRLRDR